MHLRPFRADDLPALTQLFHDTIHTVAAAHYSAEQRAAWAPAQPDLERWRAKLAAEITVIAEDASAIVGFCSWTPDGYLDFLFVHHAHQGRGIARALCAEAERDLAGRGVRRIHTQASVTAQPFFLRQGFRVVQPQTVRVRGVDLPNAVMEKLLAPVP
jgi:putative acetyltransferase